MEIFLTLLLVTGIIAYIEYYLNKPLLAAIVAGTSLVLIAVFDYLSDGQFSWGLVLGGLLVIITGIVKVIFRKVRQRT